MASIRPLKYFKGLNPPLDLTTGNSEDIFYPFALTSFALFSEISWLYLNILSLGKATRRKLTVDPEYFLMPFRTEVHQFRKKNSYDHLNQEMAV